MTDEVSEDMNSTTTIWAGAGLVLAALLIVASVQRGLFGIASVFGISIILIGAGLIANGFEALCATASKTAVRLYGTDH